MVAIEVTVPSDQIVAACLTQGLLVNNVRPSAVRFVPPLIVGRAESTKRSAMLGAALEEVGAAAAGSPAQAIR